VRNRHDKDKLPYLLKDSMQELGSTYIKLGQLIASSPTLFPDNYVEAFQSCLDQTEALPFSVIEKILENELGVKLSNRFSYIDKTPLASASIAQVHAATLKTGEQVVLKVQKPDVKTILESDFQFLHMASQLFELISPKNWKSSVSDIVYEIRAGMLEECNFLQEADNIEEFDAFLQQAGIEQVLVPKLHRELCSKKVLTMERFYGVPLSNVEAVREISPDPEFALMQALNTWFLSLKQCQIYHADLHAGNVLMLNDGRIGFIDFGIVGRLSDKTWEGLTSLVVCVPAQDFDGLALALTKIGATKESIDLKRFAEDLKAIWQKVSGEAAYEADDIDDYGRQVMMDISKVSSRHGIRFPREFTLLVKQFLYFDRYIQMLAPDMDMFGGDTMEIMGFAE
jgi:predicted unusual protein kinase regulating ubiquinone biosynthesis (AarF/ABC1/UbiB family)